MIEISLSVIEIKLASTSFRLLNASARARQSYHIKTQGFSGFPRSLLPRRSPEAPAGESAGWSVGARTDGENGGDLAARGREKTEEPR